MRLALWGKKAFAISMILILVCSYFTGYTAKVDAATSKVVLVGDLQSELSAGSGQVDDWSPDATVTQMTYTNNGTYVFTGTLPAGTYKYKVALNGTWDESYGYSSYTHTEGIDDGGNIVITLAAETTVTFYFNEITKKIADSTYYSPIADNRLPRLVGTLQSELGDAGDSSPADAKMTLSDPNFDNVYERTADLPKGDYSYSVFVPGATPQEDKSYPEHEQALNLPADLPVTFKYNAADHAVSAKFTAPVVPGNNAPVPDGHMRVHYQRTAGDYADQGLWLWDDVAVPSSGWPAGATPFPEGQTDSYGAYTDVPLKAGAKKSPS